MINSSAVNELVRFVHCIHSTWLFNTIEFNAQAMVVRLVYSKTLLDEFINKKIIERGKNVEKKLAKSVRLFIAELWIGSRQYFYIHSSTEPCTVHTLWRAGVYLCYDYSV